MKSENRRWIRVTCLLAASVALLACPSFAQDAPIADNSFLIEEAYNQEAGVVQHISTLDLPDSGSDWSYTFVQEWPFPDQRHQLSYSVPVSRFGDEEGVGDVAINYRYQWIGVGGGPLAVAPRLSLVLPSGDADEGLGAGAFGLQVNLPVSAILRERLVAHWNVGGTFTPDAEGPGGFQADTRSVQLGQGLVYLLRPTLNLLFEAVWTREDVVIGRGRTGAEESFFLSPGVRFALNRPSGLQIVPGIAFPIGVGPSEGERSVFLYLSFEHPFGR
jgi:Putative MetA-pathway of phenol degradation